MRVNWQQLPMGLFFWLGMLSTTPRCSATDLQPEAKEDSTTQQLIAQRAQQNSQQNVVVTLDENLPVKYWGNLFSMKFHRPSCPFAKAMSPHNVVFFNFRRQAIESGQIPCRYCLPPNWTTVHAQILHADALKSTTSGF